MADGQMQQGSTVDPSTDAALASRLASEAGRLLVRVRESGAAVG
jgi:hypothetical protein